MSIPSTPYQSFARIFSSYHDQYSEAGPSSRQIDTPIRYDAILDEQGGMVTSLMRALSDTIAANPASAWDGGIEDGMGPDERNALLHEHRTWQLLRAVYDNRLPRQEPDFLPSSATDVLRENPYLPPGDLAQLLVNEDDELSLWATLVDHYQSRPLYNSAPPLEARHGYLPSTIRRAKAAQLSNRQIAPLTPPSLDPDFSLRDAQGQGLAGEDQTYQTPLLATLYDLVRHGELDQAVKVCEMGGEPWRGASLMGGRRWTMGGLTSGSGNETLLEGNRRRALWKKACRAIAQNSERALYAALVSDLPVLLSNCSTWEDHLWAHLQARIESRLDGRMKELGGFWEQELAATGGDEGDVKPVGGLEEVFREIAGVQSDSVNVTDRDPYHVAQRMIILGRTDALLSQFAQQLPSLEDKTSPELISPLIRFFAHLILVLRSLGQPVPETPANAILQAYLVVLEREGNDSLVAMYAACLREGNGEESYARFLRTMDPEATREARAEALARAKTHNLDVAAIARETVRLTLEEAFAMIPALSREQPDISTFASGLTERDVYLIRSIEWLTMVPETMQDALIKANDVGRYFLALGQANAAQSLLKTLPTNITDMIPDEDDECHLEEHENMLRLFSVFACHDLVEEVDSRQPRATATKLEQHNWRKALQNAIDKTHRATVDLLTTGWMRFPISNALDNHLQRRQELQRVRQIFIPDLTLRLHALFMSHSMLFPSLIQSALDLTKVVAQEENHVYEEFFTRDGDAGRLMVYLERVREAGMASLKLGGSAFKLPVPVPARA